MDTPRLLLSPTEALGGRLALPQGAGDGKSGAADAVERLAFRVGPIGLLCASDAGREVALPPPVTRLPNLPAWMRGLANVRGTLIPVVDLAPAFGVEHQTALTRYLLVVGDGDGALGLLVDGLPAIARFGAEEKMRGLPPHPERLSGHVACGYEREGVVWLDVDEAGIFGAVRDSAAA
jgi:twitching motility protein PilI